METYNIYFDTSVSNRIYLDSMRFGNYNVFLDNFCAHSATCTSQIAVGRFTGFDLQKYTSSTLNDFSVIMDSNGDGSIFAPIYLGHICYRQAEAVDFYLLDLTNVEHACNGFIKLKFIGN